MKRITFRPFQITFEANVSFPPKHPHKFTLIEMLVVVAILAILAAMLMPGMQKALNSARNTICLNNLHGVGIAFGAYSNDYFGYYPPANSNSLNQASSTTISWDDAVYGYMGGDEDRISSTSARYPNVKIKELQCPFDKGRGDWRLSYTMALGYNPSFLPQISNNVYRCPRRLNQMRARPLNSRRLSEFSTLLLSDQHWHRGQGQGGGVSTTQYWDGANHYSGHEDGQAMMGLFMGLNVKLLWRGVDVYATAPELSWYITGPRVW